ncbi:DNA-directed RNA polymerase sigma-70 factor [Brevifollis gellanilyticus]|uniref:DNA-directed RNA polymerase sigma-70 factor n=2 Tax=Brevifollis gellanilyticus TaxID=748831 RepID=A0A512M3P0_9BACT|nr:DNA-directed RNA polymerase sigma-70 factor [Brevifollis gellanilyticus]
MPSDEELLCAIQERDELAMQVLLRRHQTLLKSVISRIVGSDAATDDALQDTLLDIWRSSHHYSMNKGKAVAWITTLAKRRAIDYVRRTATYNSLKDRAKVETKIHLTASNVGSDCEDVDLSQALQQNIRLLPAAQQEVIHLAFLQGMSQREVAAAIHLPLGTVKTRIELGLKKLRSAFRTRHAMHTLQAA